jgi:RNA polymerase primary sigma factor
MRPEKNADREALANEIKGALKCLTPTERKIIEMRFGLTDGVQHTIDEVGTTLHMTHEHMRQIEARIYKKLRQNEKVQGLITYMQE